jgi:PIN domain nuclease of toxin-antitoxin system
MKFLLDTHIFLWYIEYNEKLDKKYLDVIQNANNKIFLSTISVWEILIKVGLGKLSFEEPVIDFISSQCTKHQIELIELNITDLISYEKLPNYHKDPFDRLLINQSINRNLFFITDDFYNLKYPINTI